MSPTWSAKLLAFCLTFSSPIGVALTEAHSQNAGDYLLYKSLLSARARLLSAAREGNDDKMSTLFVQSMAELHHYKTDNKIPEGVAISPCQRAHEELAVSASNLSVYVQPSRHISGPGDRDRDGRDADQWWSSHRETFEECERYLKIEATPRFGPERLTSVLPP